MNVSLEEADFSDESEVFPPQIPKQPNHNLPNGHGSNGHIGRLLTTSVSPVSERSFSSASDISDEDNECRERTTSDPQHTSKENRTHSNGVYPKDYIKRPTAEQQNTRNEDEKISNTALGMSNGNNAFSLGFPQRNRVEEIENDKLEDNKSQHLPRTQQHSTKLTQHSKNTTTARLDVVTKDQHEIEPIKPSPTPTTIHFERSTVSGASSKMDQIDGTSSTERAKLLQVIYLVLRVLN